MKLTRSRTDRVFGGVAGGIAAAYHWDVNVVRVVAVVLGLSTGLAILAYLLLWLLLPQAP